MDKHTETPARAIRVLFVCSGNICRSPMAEAYFRHRVRNRQLNRYIVADSAGIGPWHEGEEPDPGTIETLTAHHISAEGLIARQIRADDCSQTDYLLVMDRSHLRDLPERCRIRARLLLSLTPGRARHDEVFDPYGTNRFEEVYQLMTPALDRLLEEIVTVHALDS
jgi:protein-tyrosine phosphatase